MRLGLAQPLLKLGNSSAIVDKDQFACGESPLKNRVLNRSFNR